MYKRVTLPRVTSVCDECGRAITGPAVTYKDPNDDLPYVFCNESHADDYLASEGE